MGKELPLFGDDFDMEEYRFSVWITNSEETAHEAWKQLRPRANDENTIKELKEDFALGGFSMKKFYSAEAAILLRVFIYNLFVLFRHEILGQKEKIKRLMTLRYKYFVIPAQLGGDGRGQVLRISVLTEKVKTKLLGLFNQVKRYVPFESDNCNAFG